jgi:hypothetical protein
MKQKLFENIGGNQFRLTEAIGRIMVFPRSKVNEGDFDDPVDTPVSKPEETREVQIGREILAALDNISVASTSGGLANDIRKLAQELITMHGAK